MNIFYLFYKTYLYPGAFSVNPGNNKDGRYGSNIRNPDEFIHCRNGRGGRGGRGGSRGRGGRGGGRGGGRSDGSGREQPQQTAAYVQNQPDLNKIIKDGQGYYEPGSFSFQETRFQEKRDKKKREFQEEHVQGWNRNKGRDIGSKRGKFRSANFGF